MSQISQEKTTTFRQILGFSRRSFVFPARGFFECETLKNHQSIQPCLFLPASLANPLFSPHVVLLTAKRSTKPQKKPLPLLGLFSQAGKILVFTCK